MTKKYSELVDVKRNAYNAFVSTVVRPLLGLSEKELGNLGFTGVAKRIDDFEICKRYRELAIAMLEANIAHSRPDATLMSIPTRNNTAVVVSTLIVAAIGQNHSGAVSALLVSAMWYWIANETSIRGLKRLTMDAEAHNALVANWRETVKEWEAVRDELQSL